MALLVKRSGKCESGGVCVNPLNLKPPLYVSVSMSR